MFLQSKISAWFVCTWLMTLMVLCSMRAALFLSSSILLSWASCWILSSAALLNSTLKHHNQVQLKAFPSKPSKLFKPVATYSPMTICLKVNTNIKLQGRMMKMFHSCLSASYCYLGDMNDIKTNSNQDWNRVTTVWILSHSSCSPGNLLSSHLHRQFAPQLSSSSNLPVHKSEKKLGKACLVFVNIFVF